MGCSPQVIGKERPQREIHELQYFSNCDLCDFLRFDILKVIFKPTCRNIIKSTSYSTSVASHFLCDSISLTDLHP